MTAHFQDPPAPPPPPPPKLRRGFASMDPDRLRDISSKGGSAPHRSSKRGFALMDESRRQEVSRKGLEARRVRIPVSTDPAAPRPDAVPPAPHDAETAP
ncbi:KGG domain-containing protein [Xylophilus sp. GOD-11R]|uniref:KGG domain-containing protein n=1 Tax=Xylophilus sp. GOD-11R TaxID=3089814 RepID=UPI00298D3461|nr:KGG domain-containing protein [Xylophilus sp. GOD-11R]WPB56669.1 KGG domain-containing protein [Xylophilus sp. GOD-11R]